MVEFARSLQLDFNLKKDMTPSSVLYIHDLDDGVMLLFPPYRPDNLLYSADSYKRKIVRSLQPG